MDINVERGKPLLPQLNKYKVYYLMLLPIIAWYIVFCYAPMGGILVAFENYDPFKGFFKSQWIGFHWFTYLFTSLDFGRALRNTLLINLYSWIFAFPAPIILALLLNECRHVAFKRIVQTVSYLPHFISWAITAGLLVTLLSPSSGIVNQVMKLIGIEPIYFMAESSYTRTIIVASSIWKGVGWGSILYLASLTGINPELYEAARLDGASKWMQVWHITLPGMSNIIVMQLLFMLTSLVDVGFEQAYTIVNKATYETGLVISTYIYNVGVKQGEYSFTTAVGLAQSVVGMLLLIGANAMTRKFKPDGAIW